MFLKVNIGSATDQHMPLYAIYEPDKIKRHDFRYEF